jgi:hypothetical protein
VPWRRPSVARSRRRVARIRQALRALRVWIGYDRVSTPADLAPSVLNRIALRKLRTSYGAHADMLGARFGVRADEDGHLTLLRAHGVVAHVGCCCCHPPNARKCHRELQGPCIERGPCANYLRFMLRFGFIVDWGPGMASNCVYRTATTNPFFG